MYTIEEGPNSFILTKGKRPLSIEEMKELLGKLQGKANYLTVQNFCQSHDEQTIKIDKRTKNLEIEVSPDFLSAYVTYIEKPQAEDIIEESNRSGISSLMDKGFIQKQLDANIKKIEIAKGTPPGESQDEKIIWMVKIPEKHSEISSRKNVDYYNLDIFTYVKKGEKICNIIPPVTGACGVTVYGKKILAPHPKKTPIRFSGDFEKSDTAVYAKDDGVLQLKNDHLQLEKVLKISGDIDYQTGNIDSTVNVFISGWLRTGFTVKSEKSVFIEGGVEEKTQVYTGGDLSVVLGIMGNKKTTIEVEGDLKAKFIQDTTIHVKKNIYVNEYIMNSDVQCEGSVYVNGKKGFIINSVVDAKVSVEMKQYKTSQENRGIKVKGFQRGMYLKTLKELHERQKSLKEKLIYFTIKLRGIKRSNVELLQYTLSEYNKCQHELAEVKDVIEEIELILKKVEGEGMVKIMADTDDVSLKIKGQEVNLSGSKPVKLYYDPEKKGIVKECLEKS